MEEEQIGFRRGRSTIDAIFCLRQVCERKWEYNKKVVMAFLDIAKAYDSIDRRVVWQELEKRKVDQGVVEMVREMYEGSQSCVKTGVGCSEWFEIRNGMRQGSALSPLLFIVAMDGIQKAVKERKRKN